MIVIGLKLDKIVGEMRINDNYNFKVGTNVDLKQGLRTYMDSSDFAILLSFINQF